MLESKVYRVILVADPAPVSERRAPHCVVYVETDDAAQARHVALGAARSQWAAYTVASGRGAPTPSEGIAVASAIPLGADERWAFEHHREDFEVTDRWRLRRGIDLHEAGPPWWETLGELRRRLGEAGEAEVRPSEVDDAALAEVAEVLGS